MSDNYNYNYYQDAVTRPLSNLFERVIAYLPNILAAGIILLAGWIIGSFVGGLLRKALHAIGIDSISERVGLKQLSARSGHTISIPAIVEWVVKWFFILASIIAAADVLGIMASQISSITTYWVMPVMLLLLW